MSVYFERYAFKKQLISSPPNANLGMVVTIPCFNEQHLNESLASLAYCHPGRWHVEVIVVINHSEEADDEIKTQNRETYQSALAFAQTYNSEHITFHILLEELPPKHAGVGLARKIAMDEAARRLDSLGKHDGPIVCFDADSLCDDNYLLTLEIYFSSNKNSPGCSIYFEHPLDGELTDENYQAIIDYELFLRFYVHALRCAGFPHAYQTIGSSMAVRNSIYQQQGGMNRRKAGEDFYFLHKIIPLGNFGEIKSTRVIPSPRKSDRVPFGTGKAVNEWLQKGKLDTYHPDGFKDLQQFYSKLNMTNDLSSINAHWLQELPRSIIEFGAEIDLSDHIQRIINNSKNIDTFKHNFHRWFDGFKVLKYIHFVRDNYYPDVPIKSAVNWLLEELNLPSKHSAKEMLICLRELDRK